MIHDDDIIKIVADLILKSDDFNIIALTETMLKPGIDSLELFGSSSDVFRFDRFTFNSAELHKCERILLPEPWRTLNLGKKKISSREVEGLISLVHLSPAVLLLV